MAKRYPTTEDKRAEALAGMKRTVAAIGPHALFRAHANNMAAGPCAACLAIDGQTYAIADVPLMPLDDCPHPDQCVGRYQFVLDIDRALDG